MKDNHSRIEEFLKELTDDILVQKECQIREPESSVLSLKFSDGHTHHHVSSDKNLTKKIIEDLIAHIGLDLSPPRKDLDKKPIIFRNRQAIGDILMFTAAIRDFHNAFPDWPVNVQSTAMHLWDHNPHLDRSLNNSNAEVIEVGPGILTNASNRDDRHFANAFRLSIQDKLGIRFPQGPIKPDIWMTKEEIKNPIVEPPYWIIVAGEKGDWTAKTYPFKRWKEFVNTYSNIKFVQVGAREHKHPKLESPNVINMIGKTQDKNTGIRDLFRLFYFAEGSMGLVSFQMHLAAAFGMPCVVVAGAREPARFTRYPGHQYLATDGCLPCAATGACWYCDLEKTCPTIITGENGQRIPKCVDLIRTQDIIRAFEQYYQGGRLSFDSPRVPTLPNPISSKIEIPMQRTITTTMRPGEENQDKIENINLHGFNWNGACITDLDWEFLRGMIKKFNIKTVLEFGPGLSTFLMVDEGLSVVAFETRMDWIKSLKEIEIDDKIDLHQWDGKIIHQEIPKFDMALVDGPPGGKSREMSTKIASEHANIVLIHDAGREWERKWQDLYLKDKFEGPIKGGHRFSCWVRRDSNLEIKEPEIIVPSLIKDQKIFRIFNHSRGDGGSARSANYFMEAFLKLGWRVEYVYDNPQPSGTHRRIGNPKVVATNSLELLRAPCDVFMLVTDDFIWDFDKPEVVDIFSNINAERKVMYVNYRAGKLGEIPWTRGWDKYFFLNDSLRESLVTAYMRAMGSGKYYSISSRVLSPPVEIEDYLKIEPDYSGPMKIIRHSSQGDAKYSKDFNKKIEAILETFPEATIRLMPAPSFINDFGERVICHKRNDPEVKEFLKLGNIYWYDLPDNYTEGGPRTIVEAMAAGLPCIANKASGPKDRIEEGTGFLYNDFESSLELFKLLDHESTRRFMGKTAKEHAKIYFDPNNWIKEIIGE